MLSFDDMIHLFYCAKFFWPEFETSTLPSRAFFCLLHRGGEKQALHKTMFPLNRITTAPEGKPYRI